MNHSRDFHAGAEGNLILGSVSSVLPTWLPGIYEEFCRFTHSCV